MRRPTLGMAAVVLTMALAPPGWAAYHHMGETDSPKFLETYPEAAGTKVDQCALCHTGGSYEKSGKTVTVGSCQWCHYKYGLDGSGPIAETLNSYGAAYLGAGRSRAAVTAIDGLDSDGDGYTNRQEIQARRFPGTGADDPSKVAAPSRVYTLAQLEAMERHTQFLLMNTSRSGDFYAEYTGVPMEELLKDATAAATGIVVYAPDGYSYSYPLDPVEDPGVYHVRGVYPAATYWYDGTAEAWCDYGAPSVVGRSPGSDIHVEGGLKMLLAYKREGAYLDQGHLTDQNRLDGEGPFRLVPPQKDPGPPDQLQTSSNLALIWPYLDTADHNAGASARTATMIKVEPLPQGTTEIDPLEAGWSYVEQNKIVVYGAIDGSDANGNGVLDSEEGTGDLDGDGVPDAEDRDTARFEAPSGAGKVGVRASVGELAAVEVMTEDDPSLPEAGRPDMSFPYGAMAFQVVGLSGPGDSVTVTLTFPAPVPVGAKYYKVDGTGTWSEVPLGSNDGDAVVTVTLTDGDPATDADGLENGVVTDPGALAVPKAVPSSGDSDGGGCLIRTLGDAKGTSRAAAGWLLAAVVALLAGLRVRRDRAAGP